MRCERPPSFLLFCAPEGKREKRGKDEERYPLNSRGHDEKKDGGGKMQPSYESKYLLREKKRMGVSVGGSSRYPENQTKKGRSTKVRGMKSPPNSRREVSSLRCPIFDPVDRTFLYFSFRLNWRRHSAAQFRLLLSILSIFFRNFTLYPSPLGRRVRTS